MLELTDKRLISLLWMLKNKSGAWNMSELRRGADAMLGKESAVYKQTKPFPIIDLALTYGPTFRLVKELEESGLLTKDTKTQEYRVSKAVDLIRFISSVRPFKSLKTISYFSPLDFSGTLKMIKQSKQPYAFTIFAGSELYHPYVKTDQVHAYIGEGDEKKWEKYLISKKCLKAQKNQANIFLIPTRQQIFFTQAQTIKGFSIAPPPILLSDLFSFGSLAEEQANFLLEEWLNNKL